MTWDRRAPVNPKYRTPEHRAEVKRLKAQMERDGQLWCAQPECIMSSRLILPHMPFAAGHNDAGTDYIGPVHRDCNNRDGAKRARARQLGRDTTYRRWVI